MKKLPVQRIGSLGLFFLSLLLRTSFVCLGFPFQTGFLFLNSFSFCSCFCILLFDATVCKELNNDDGADDQQCLLNGRPPWKTGLSSLLQKNRYIHTSGKNGHQYCKNKRIFQYSFNFLKIQDNPSMDFGYCCYCTILCSCFSIVCCCLGAVSKIIC